MQKFFASYFRETIETLKVKLNFVRNSETGLSDISNYNKAAIATLL